MVRPYSVAGGKYLWLFYAVICLALVCALAGESQAQTATYRLHKEASSTTGLFQLKTAAPDGTSLAIQTADLKAAATGEKLIKAFDTQSGVPNTAGTIPSGSTVTFTLWMKKTANFGVMTPRAKVFVNSATGAALCTATGASALTTTLASYTLTCNTGANVTMSATDRFYVWVGVNLTTGNSANTFKAEVDIEGTANGNYDSQVVVPLGRPTPSITSLTPTSGPKGTAVTINGSNFGATQGTSSIKFNGVTATPTSWSASSINAPVPTGATTGPVVVTVGGLSSAGSAFTVTNAPPTVSLTSPAANATFAANSNITINANAADADGTVSKVEFFQGATKLGEDLTTPYSFAWNNVAPGSYSLTAKATDNSAAITTSTAVNIIVNNPPTASLTAPLAGALFQAPANINLSANSTDSDGTVSKVEFFQGATKLGEDLTSPYTFAWTNAAAGSYSLTATATDNLGLTTTSTAVNITVNNPPTVNITNPAQNANFNANSTVTISANASDADGSISKVEFYQGATKLGEDLVAPYSFDWTNVPAGAYALTARALDNSSGVTASAAVNITVTALGSVSGRVTKADGTTALPGATIKLVQAGTQVGTTVTNGTGDYTLSGISAGSYSVEASATNYETQIQNSVVVTNGANTTVNFSLASDSSIIYVYDQLGRLVSASAPNGESATYSYDAVGNLLSITRQNPTQVAITYITPTRGIAGASVNITGMNFGSLVSNNTVQFNGAQATVLSASTTQLVVSVPQGATTGPVSVTAPGGSVTSSVPFTMLPTSSITGFTPTIGKAGTAVMISGDGFQPSPSTNEVRFNATPASVTSSTATSITATVPPSASSGHIFAGISVEALVGSAADFYVVPNTYELADVDTSTLGRLAVGGSRTVTLNTAGKISMTLFEGTAGQKLSLTLSGVSIPSSRVVVYKMNGAEMISGTVTPGGGVIHLPVFNMTGTYTILVDPKDAGVGSITLSLAQTVGDDSSLTLDGPPAPVSIRFSGGSLTLPFNGTAGQRVRLSASQSTVGAGVLSISNPDGTTLVTTPISVKGSVVDIQALPTSGAYALHLYATSPGSATLNLTSVAAGAIIPLVYDGSPVTNVITADGQLPQLSFTGNAGQRIGLAASDDLSITPSVVALKSPDGSLLDTFSGGFVFRTLFMPGLHMVTVTPPATSLGSVTVTLASVPPSPTTLLSFGSEVSTSGALGQNVWVGFDGTAGQKVSLKAYYPGATYTYFTLAVYAPDGTQLLPPVYVGDASFSSFTGDIRLPLTGRYLVLLDPGDGYAVNARVTLFDASDLTGTITPDGTPVSVTAAGTVTVFANAAHPGQNARLTFNALAGQRVALTGTKTSTYGDADISLLAPDGSVLGASFYLGSIGCCNSVNAGSVPTQTLPQDGIYTVLVDPQAASGITVSLRLTTVPPDQTGSISINGAPVTVNIGSAEQNAKLTFSATAGQHVKLDLSNVSIAASAVTILRPDGTTLPKRPDGVPFGFINAGTAGGTTDAPKLPDTGTYSILIDPASTNTGAMTLTLTSVTDATGSLTAGGAALPINITSAGQNAKATFSATAGQHLKLTFSGVTVPYSYVYLLKPDGTPFVNRDITAIAVDTSGYTIVIPFVPVTGTYTVLVDPNDANQGSMTLALTEIIDQIKTTTPGGAAVTSTVTTAGQNTKMTFTGTAGQHLSLRLSAVTVPSSNISVYKPDGAAVAPTLSVGTSGGFYDIPITPVTGSYTVIADLLDNTGAMTFTLTATTDVTGTLTVGGAPLNVNIATARQNARPTFSATAGQRISLKMSGVTITSSQVSIVKPDGTTLVAPFNVGTNGSLLESALLPSSGTYTVLVDPDTTRTGLMTLTLYDATEITGTISPGGSPVPLSINNPGQNATLTMSGAANQRVTVLVANSDSCYITVQLLAPDGRVLASGGGNGNIMLTTATLPVTGNYTITVDPNAADTGSMSVIVTNP